MPSKMKDRRPSIRRRRAPLTTRSRNVAVAALAVVLAAVGLSLPTAQAAPDGSALVITEVFTRGGSSGAPYQHKFVEIANPTSSPLALDGLSLQYVPARGGTASSTCALSGTVAARSTYVIVVGSNGSEGEAITGDASCETNPGAAGGTFALVRGTARHTFVIGSNVGDAEVVDLVSWGTAASVDTQAAPAVPGNTLSYQRAGATDTDDNAADLTGAAPTPGVVVGLDTPAPTPEPTPQPTPDPTDSAPAQPITPIADIQGTGEQTPYADQTVTTLGVVTAVYPTGGFSGFYIQTPGSGGVPRSPGQASDGLFVYDRAGATSLAPGQCVQVTGTATEYQGLTQLSGVSETVLVTDCAPVVPTEVSETAWPATDTDKEPYEAMLLRPTGAWTVTSTYTTNQYGQVGLAVGAEPLYQATDVVAPGAAAVAYEEANRAKEVLLDDGSSWNYTTNATTKGQPLPYLTADKPLRVGDAVTFTSDVVLDYRHGWNLQPLTQVNGLTGSPIDWQVSRPAAPQVGGEVSVTSFNVLNYFTDLGQDEAGCRAYRDRDDNPVTANRCAVRGAYSTQAFLQQQDKIVAAINELDSSVVGLEEIENSAKFGHDRDASLAQLVNALNAAAGYDKWAYVPSPAARPAAEVEDSIRTAFIYQPAVVTPVGESVILDDEAFTGTARQPLAQAFKAVGADDVDAFVVIVNHFKSKGSVLPGAGNADSGDGQGANNAQRVAQAQALVAWAAQWNDRPVLLVGDFNSYAQEDPITAMEAAGYTLINDVVDGVGHSYQYSGRLGSLDHVLLNAAAVEFIAGARVWDVNADESIAYEYSRANYNVTQLYAADPYRSSDHDPIKVGLNPRDSVAECAAAGGAFTGGVCVMPSGPTASASATSGDATAVGTPTGSGATGARRPLARTGAGLGGLLLAAGLLGGGAALTARRRRA